MLWHFLLMFSEFSELFLDFFWEHIKVKLNIEKYINLHQQSYC
jgi:hypothetical protein